MRLYRGCGLLTSRQYEIVEHVVAGEYNKCIAKDLNISYRTLRTHIEHIHEKLGTHNIAQLCALVWRGY